MLGQFTTTELEGMLEKFPYFEQAHLLLAKKYQQENSPKFDQQLQLAALYIQDRELLYTLFNEKSAIVIPAVSKGIIESTEQPVINQQTVETIAVSSPEIIPVTLEKVEVTVTEDASMDAVLEEIKRTARELSLLSEKTIEEKQEPAVEEPQPEIEKEEVKAESVVEFVAEETEEPALEETSLIEEKPSEIFSRIEPHTFDDWLKAFNNKSTPVVKEEAVVEKEETEEEKDELSELLAANTSVDYLHELVKEETNYSKGLERFIEEQIQKHKQPEVKKTAPESEVNTEPATETMARVYEMQKKYAKAIKTYEALTLKFPEKSSLFAARINYLKNIV